MSKPIPLGTRAQVEEIVTLEHTLTHRLSSLPPVLSTPNMIELMEFACFRAAEPYCQGDEITVGTAIHVEHLAATGVGALVKAEAVLASVAGKQYIFRVRAWDQHHEIGRGTVHRAFVSVGRFLKRVAAKTAASDQR